MRYSSAENNPSSKISLNSGSFFFASRLLFADSFKLSTIRRLVFSTFRKSFVLFCEARDRSKGNLRIKCSEPVCVGLERSLQNDVGKMQTVAGVVLQ